ncbi:MAG: hypothetical protein AB7K52_04400 [Phycisphaerales bacterium]
MGEIRRVIRRAGLRLMLSAFLRSAVYSLTVAIVAVMALRVASIVLGFGVDWALVARWAPAAVLGASLLWTLITYPRTQAIARRVDEGANLKDSISTALSVQGMTDPWCQTVVESAVAKARGVDVSRAVPVEAPRAWPLPMTAALACVVVWLLPLPADVLGRLQAKEKTEQQRKEVVAAKVEAKVAMSKIEDAMKKFDPEAAKDLGLKDLDKKDPEATTPEEIRRAAIKRVESMQDKLEQLRSQSDAAQTADALKDMLKQLKNSPGPMEDVVKAMAKGDMGQALEELRKLEEKMASGQMSDSQKEQLGKQLSNLKGQLEKLAQSQKSLEDKLRQAGLDPKLAGDPEALRKALEQNENLSEEQKQALSKAAKAQECAGESCQSMAQAMGKMATKMGQQGQGEQGEGSEGQQGMQELSESMSEMEMMMAEAQQMDAAMSEAQHQLKQLCEGMGQCQNPGMGQCQNGLMDKPWSPGDNQAQGNRRGGHGQAQGGSNTEEVADENWTKRKVSPKTGQGPIIGSTLIQGEQVKGESTATFAAVAEAADANASEALENNVIPREYHDVVKHYFGRLKAKSKAQAPEKAAPASESKDAAKDEKKEEPKDSK